MAVKREALQRFSQALLAAAGSDPEEARVVAEVLVWSNRIGRPNQGVWRLPVLCERLAKGLYESPCHLDIEMTGSNTLIVDGGSGQGHFVAQRAMAHGLDVARREGLAAVAVRNSNYYGAGGYYAGMAADAGMIGLAFSNSFPKVRAFGGSAAVLGTNPLAFACPTPGDEPLMLDMATSALAGSTVRKRHEQSNGRTRVDTVLDPMGGAKGYGLGLMVEVLAGVLTGAGFSHQVNSMYKDFHNPGNNGHFFIALDIGRFMSLEHFRGRMLTLMEWLRDSGEGIQIPGENRWQSLKVSNADGVKLDTATLEALRHLGTQYNVPFPDSPVA